METWLKLSIWVAVYGFLKDCQPLDSYITQYLVSPPMNFTSQDVSQKIYPIATYVGLIELVFVFLLTDCFRYRPVIIVNALSYVGMMVTLIWFTSLEAMWVMEICFGTMMSTEVAYYTYIYTKVGKEHYQAVTSYMRTSSLLGRCFGCFLGQILMMKNMLNYSKLCYIQLTGAISTFLWAFMLPPVQTSLYFYRYDNTILDKSEGKPVVSSNDIHHNVENGYSPTLKEISRVPCSSVIRRLWEEFVNVYTNPYTLKWSIWYALFQCGYNQEGTYSQTLWQHIHEERPSGLLSYTGVTESAYTIFDRKVTYFGVHLNVTKFCWSIIFLDIVGDIDGFKQVEINTTPLRSALMAFASSYIVINGNISSEFIMGGCAIFEGILVLWAAMSTHLWQAFFSHVLFAGVYYFAVSIGYSEIAKNIPSDCFALVFGINNFFSLLIQTFLTATFSAKGGLELESREQFLIHGIYFMLLGFVFLIKCFYSILRPAKSATIIKTACIVSK